MTSPTTSQPSSAEELSNAQWRQKYLQDVNHSLSITTRMLRVQLTIAKMNGEVLPEAAKYLYDELLSMAQMLEDQRDHLPNS